MLVCAMLIAPLFIPGGWSGGLLNKPSAVPPSVLIALYYISGFIALLVLCSQMWLQRECGMLSHDRSVDVSVSARIDSAFNIDNIVCSRNGMVDVSMSPRWDAADHQVSFVVFMIDSRTGESRQIGDLVFDGGACECCVQSRAWFTGSCSLQLRVKDYRSRVPDRKLSTIDGDVKIRTSLSHRHPSKDDGHACN